MAILLIPINKRINLPRLGKTIFISFKWIVTTKPALLIAAAVLSSLFFTISFHTDQWHWFQRSGALLISIGAILSTRRLLRQALDCLLLGKAYFEFVGVAGKQTNEEKEDVKAAYCGFWMVGVGTIIWAYGDLTSCLLTWSGSCLA